MKIAINYEDLTVEQKLRTLWHVFCNADPVPETFADDMEAAGYIIARPVTQNDVGRMFSDELGIVNNGAVWELTPAGRTALKNTRNSL